MSTLFPDRERERPPNLSTAVMARRLSPLSSLDYFPTPAWAVRALADRIGLNRSHRVLEPAAGGGHMSDVLAEYAGEVVCSDLADPEGRGWGGVDFRTLPPPEEAERYDWLITNPPFKLAELFATRSAQFAHRRALIARLSFLEGGGRWRRLWAEDPCTDVYVFARRVSFKEGRLAGPKETSATAYAWFVWNLPPSPTPRVRWITEGP